jgi:two-component system secretion response regulator SsrB
MVNRQETMGCVLLASRHHGLTEGIRGLLETSFKAVIMVGDEASLFESATRLPLALAVVDLSLSKGEGIDLLRRLHTACPQLKMIAISAHDETSVSQAVLAAGADGFVLKRSIATDLLCATDAVLKGQRYLSPATLKHQGQ